MNKIKEFFYNFWKLIDRDDVLTSAQQSAFDIFNVCLYDENNIRYLNSYKSDKKYIVTKSYILDKNISTFIILNHTNNKITIVNHQYQYDMSMPNKTIELMNKMFNDKVEEEREGMEKEILSNITQSLDIVLKQFKEKLPPLNTSKVNIKQKK